MNISLPSTMDAAYKIALKWQELMERHASSSKRKSSAEENSEVVMLGSSEQEARTNSARKRGRVQTGAKKDTSAGESGEVTAKEARHQKARQDGTCYKCGRTNHIAVNCRGLKHVDGRTLSQGNAGNTKKTPHRDWRHGALHRWRNQGWSRHIIQSGRIRKHARLQKTRWKGWIFFELQS